MISPQFTEAGDSWTFMCQHGPQECYGNIVQACILNQVSQQPEDKTEDTRYWQYSPIKEPINLEKK